LSINRQQGHQIKKRQKTKDERRKMKGEKNREEKKKGENTRD
jgi:hypothetical protein